MRRIASHRSTTVIAGVFLLAFVAAANTFAADRAAPAGAAQPADGARASAKSVVSSSVPGTSARVYLDDYQRIPQMVTKQYPTKAYWIGAKRAQSKAPGKTEAKPQTKAPG